jgi:hypothetical protein
MAYSSPTKISVILNAEFNRGILYVKTAFWKELKLYWSKGPTVSIGKHNRMLKKN